MWKEIETTSYISTSQTDVNLMLDNEAALQYSTLKVFIVQIFYKLVVKIFLQLGNSNAGLINILERIYSVKH